MVLQPADVSNLLGAATPATTGKIMCSINHSFLRLSSSLAYRKRWWRSSTTSQQTALTMASSHRSIAHETKVPAALTQYKFKELEKATQGFHKLAKLGKGAYNKVCKGELQMRPSTTGEADLVAVKQLNAKALEDTDKFFREINEIYRLRHERLVKLVGWCYDMKHRAMLVYELMRN
jgi:hypothetical protein